MLLLLPLPLLLLILVVLKLLLLLQKLHRHYHPIDVLQLPASRVSSEASRHSDQQKKGCAVARPADTGTNCRDEGVYRASSSVLGLRTMRLRV